jgi:hypothetical protein
MKSMDMKIMMASKLIGNTDRVILAKYKGEWVTWIYDQETEACYYGEHYGIDQLDAALGSYLERCEEYGVTSDGDFVKFGAE